MKGERDVSKPLPVNTHAPVFLLKDNKGNTVSLNDFQGKKNVVLVFYPRNNTPGCNRQLSNLRDDYEKFAALATEVVAVNPASIESHDKYCQQKNFPFSILSDGDRAVAQAYHALKANGKSIQRTVYIIDTQSKIRFAEQGMPDDKRLIDAIRSFE